jgi:anaerobic magnesium-protoporphyrin IX monomethyl ester cyclase
LVINSPLFREYNPLYDEDALPPIGLGYIATALERAGVSVRLVDAIAERICLEHLIQRVIALQPRVIAINVFTTNYDLVREFVERLSGECRHIIVGGLSTRTLYKEIFCWKFDGELDVVLGDGERVIVALVNGNIEELPSDTAERRRYFKVTSSSSYYVSDISDVPLNRAFFSNEPIAHPRGFLEANIVASRGCIYNCAFCAAARSANKDMSIRERSIESVKRELIEIGLTYPNVTSIRVLDDLFLKKAESVGRAAEIFEGFGYQWRGMAHVLTFQGVPLSDLVRLKASGCSELFIGIESGSERVLRQIHKTSDIGKIRGNLEHVMEAGISIKGYFIYGFPKETKADFEETYQLALALKRASIRNGVNFRTSVFQFRPYHGTELHQRLVSNGMPSQAVLQVAPNVKLSALVGRLQFNFHSGEYSSEDSETVKEYIYKTANLTDPTLWGFGAEDDVAGMPRVRVMREPAAVDPTPAGSR